MSEHIKIKGGDLEKTGISRILLIQLGDIGDVVLTIGCLKALRDQFPKARIEIALRKKAADLMELCQEVDGMIAIDPQKRTATREIAHQYRFFRDLRAKAFDLVIDLRTGTRGAFLSFLSGAPRRVSFYGKYNTLWRNRLFTHLFKRPHDASQHMAEFYHSLLAAYDITIPDVRPTLKISLARQSRALMLLGHHGIAADRPLLAIQPFSLWPHKEWPLEHMMELIRRLTNLYNLRILIIGGPDERERAGRLTASFPRQVHNLAGLTTLSMLAAVLDRCRLFIGVDSAGCHIAAAVGTPTITIYGPTPSFAWAPRGRRHVVVTKNLPCLPCDEKGCQGKGYARCLHELKVEDLWPTVVRQISAFVPEALQ